MTIRLVRIVAASFDTIDGELALSSGLDPLELPLDRFCNMAWAWAIRPADHAENPENEIKKFRARIWQPPAGVTPTAGPWSAEAETAAFGSFAAQVKNKGPDPAQ